MEREAGSPPRWSTDLPADIAAAILRHLPSQADHLRFAAVCNLWRAVAKRQYRPPLPWLALPDGTFFSFPGSGRFQFPTAAHYHGSCNDWLLFDHGSDGYLLLNPFSQDTVRLPGLNYVQSTFSDSVVRTWSGFITTEDEYYVPSKMSMQNLVMCPGHAVAAIVGDGRLGKIAMCRTGGDIWLINTHDQWRCLRDITFYDGRLYAVEDNGDLFEMGIGENKGTGEPKVVSTTRVILGSLTMPVSYGEEPVMRYLLLSSGMLLMVCRALRKDATTSEFTVYKANFALLRWSEVRNIGNDKALFVSRWSSFSRLVFNYKLPGNRIYFLDDDGFGLDGGTNHFGACDMYNRLIYPLLPPVELHNGSGNTPATWLIPRDEEERTLNLLDLPADALDQVLCRLHSYQDHVHLSMVCRDLRASVRRTYWNQNFVPRLAMAYLVLPHGRAFRYPDLKSCLFPDCAGFMGAICDDWLLFRDDKILRLMSPFTGKTRLLPFLDEIREDHQIMGIVDELCPKCRILWPVQVRKIVLCSDGILAAIVGCEHFAMVALCSLEAFSWSLTDYHQWLWYADLAFCNGRLYVLTAGEDLLAFDIALDDSTGEPFVYQVQQVIVGGSAKGYDSSATIAHYLVPSSDGTLLMVRRIFPLQEEEPAAFTVFRADSTTLQWVEERYLGQGKTLFIGSMCSKLVTSRNTLHSDQIFFSPDDYGGTSLWNGKPDDMMRRAFPFKQMRRASDHHAAIYDMLDGTTTSILPQQPGILGQGLTWLFPNTGLDK